MLHQWRIDEWQYARHEERRGRRHAYESIDARRTALVAIDMMPFFVEANPYAAGIVPNINRLAGALRLAGGLVAWVAPARTEPKPARREFLGDAIADRYRDSGVYRSFGDVRCTDELLDLIGCPE